MQSMRTQVGNKENGLNQNLTPFTPIEVLPDLNEQTAMITAAHAEFCRLFREDHGYSPAFRNKNQ